MTGVSALAERHDAARRYVAAVLLVALGLLIRLPFQPALGASVPFLTFYPIIIVSAWWGGLGPGLVSTGLSAAAIFLYSGSVLSTALNRTVAQVLLFVATGAFVSFITGQFRNTRREAIEQARIARERLRLLQHEQEERKRAEAAEELQRQLSTQTLAGIGDAVIATDDRSRITLMNAVAEELTGWRFEQVKGSPVDKVFRTVNEETGETVECPVNAVLRNQAMSRLANGTALLTQDGRRIPVEDSGAPIRDVRHQVIGSVLVFRDVTEARRTQAELKASEKQLSDILESITDGLLVVDSNYRFTYVNAAAEHLLHCKREHALGRNLWEEYPGILDTVAHREYVRAMTERVPVTFQNLYEPWGRWFDVRAYPHRGGGISIYFRDITDIKNQQVAMQDILRQLDESSAILDTIFEEAPVGVGLWDQRLQCVRVNRALADMSGLPAEAHVGKTMRELFPQLDPRVMESLQSVLATGVPILNHEEWGRTISGSGQERFWSSSYYPVRVRDEIIGVGAISQDVTEQRVVEQQLRHSEAQFRQIADGLPQLVWTAAPDGSLEYFNRRWYEFTGFSMDGGPGMGWREILHPDDRERTMEAWLESLKTGAFYQNEHRFRRSDGFYRWFLGRAVPIVDQHHTIIRWFGTCTDIDEQKRNEQALRQANSDLEQFAYSASHDLQEPLRNITAFTQLLAKQYGGKLDGDAELYIGYVVGGAKRMEHLIRDLLSYTRVAGAIEPPRHAVDANEVVLKAITNLRAMVEANDAIVTSERLPQVSLHETHLLQVFQNLIGNGIKYRREEQPRIDISARIEGGWTIFSVRDNGIGIDRQFADRIFGIFRRLHSGDRYEGTGIGLAICQKIVERHGGRIWVESELGKGSLFQFSLPRGGDQ